MNRRTFFSFVAVTAIASAIELPKQKLATGGVVSQFHPTIRNVMYFSRPLTKKELELL